MSEFRTQWGRVRIRRLSAQLTGVDAESDRGAAFAQGYVAGRARLWQLELTRRVARGTTAALLGEAAVATDVFQRHLGLGALATRAAREDAGSEQAGLITAYVDGINQALRRARLLPLELLLLGHRPRPFTVDDVYLVAQLKYFINSAWRFELLHTLIRGALDPARADELFAVYTLEGAMAGAAGDRVSALPRGAVHTLSQEAAASLAAGLAGLDRLGLSSPDIGSNAFAVSGTRTYSGYPLLASDPHMGLVNPGFNLLFRITTGDGLRLFGAHFPGCPGIVVGRNQHLAWGMVGLMADNQDLSWGRVDLRGPAARVSVGGRWQPLTSEPSTIAVRGADSIAHVAHGFSGGRLLYHRGDAGLFFRWPALDHGLGSVALAELNRASDWGSFRRGLARMHNAPMIAVYADRTGNIGLQTVGLIPRRRAPVGSLVQALDRPESAWGGYLEPDELPRLFNPPSGVIVYANQYERALFDDAPHLTNRWHPPARAARIHALLDARHRHDAASLAAIQDDRTDELARRALPWLLAQVRAAGPLGDSLAGSLAGWHGDTRQTTPALLFERWLEAIAEDVLAAALPAPLAAAYPDQWPGHRWNLLAALREHAAAWGRDRAAVSALLERALAQAARPQPAPRVDYRHALRRHPLARLLFSASHAYDGGSRETVHVARRNIDFLTARQSGGQRRGGQPYSFGPAFKLICDLAPGADNSYLSNTPTSGLPLGPALAPTLSRWRRGRRYRTRL